MLVTMALTVGIAVANVDGVNVEAETSVAVAVAVMVDGGTWYPDHMAPCCSSIRTTRLHALGDGDTRA
jgi:hypothetical protein